MDLVAGYVVWSTGNFYVISIIHDFIPKTLCKNLCLKHRKQTPNEHKCPKCPKDLEPECYCIEYDYWAGVTGAHGWTVR